MSILGPTQSRISPSILWYAKISGDLKRLTSGVNLSASQVMCDPGNPHFEPSLEALSLRFDVISSRKILSCKWFGVDLGGPGDVCVEVRRRTPALPSFQSVLGRVDAATLGL